MAAERDSAKKGDVGAEGDFLVQWGHYILADLVMVYAVEEMGKENGMGRERRRERGDGGAAVVLALGLGLVGGWG